MTATNHTEHYELSQYTDNDHPTYTGDYNGDMSKIDSAIYAASQSGIPAVAHTNDLTGDGSTGNPLGVADTIARTEDIPSLDGYATTESVTQAIAAAIADRLTAKDIKPGDGINISTSGNQITISYAGGGLSAVAHDNTLTGSGTGSDPLGIGVGYSPQKPKDVYSLKVPDVPYVMAAESADVLPSGDYGPLVTLNGFVGQDILLFFPRSEAHGTHFWIGSMAGGAVNKNDWREIASISDIPDVSALTSRIAALESKVAALTAAATPSATGLTAE